MLRTEGLVKRFGALVAVDRMTVQIPTGQMVGVIGRSGAGKSTFLRLINRLLAPSHGTVHYRDVDITVLKGRKLREWRAVAVSSSGASKTSSPSNGPSVQ